MTTDKILKDNSARVENSAKDLPYREMPHGKVKFEVFGEEMLEKEVKLSGNSGRVYLPPDWVGHYVKIIRVS